MSTVTYYAAQPFEVTKRGRLIAGQPQEAATAESALRKAARLAAKGGAIAFSRTGDSDLNEFEEPVILARFGTVPTEDD